MISPNLIAAYRDFIDALSPEERKIKIALLSGDAFTREELVKHLESGDKIGRAAVSAFLESTRKELAERPAHALSDRALSEDDLVEATVDSFYRAAQVKRKRKG